MDLGPYSSNLSECEFFLFVSRHESQVSEITQENIWIFWTQTYGAHLKIYVAPFTTATMYSKLTYNAWIWKLLCPEHPLVGKPELSSGENIQVSMWLNGEKLHIMGNHPFGSYWNVMCCNLPKTHGKLEIELVLILGINHVLVGEAKLLNMHQKLILIELVPKIISINY